MPRGEKTKQKFAASVAKKVERFFVVYPQERVVYRTLRIIGLLPRTWRTQLKDRPELAARFETMRQEVESVIRCSICKVDKPPDQFPKLVGKRLFARCRTCHTTQAFVVKNSKIGRFRSAYGGIKIRDPQTNLTPEILVEMWDRQQGRCYYTGTPMSLESGRGFKNWNVVSVDKKTPDKGYTVQNCVLCSASTNTAKGNRTEEEFLSFCRTVVDVAARRR